MRPFVYLFPDRCWETNLGFRLANIDGRAVFVMNEHWFDIATISRGELSSEPREVVAHPDRLAALYDTLSSSEPSGAMAGARLRAPLPNPPKSFGVGLNYKMHAMESAWEPPKKPMLFAKLPSCISGPFDDVPLRGDRCDYEGELVVVIGPGGKDIKEADAWKHVAGLTVGQDISDREVQLSNTQVQQTMMAKSFDGYGPIGPVLVSPDLLNLDSLTLTTLVNEEERQRARVSDMIFSIPFLIAYLSHVCTLETGDLVFTGTPDGVGMPQGKFLRDGDVITTTVSGIGQTRNRCLRVS